jgi:hypothetical protein
MRAGLGWPNLGGRFRHGVQTQDRLVPRADDAREWQ